MRVDRLCRGKCSSGPPANLLRAPAPDCAGREVKGQRLVEALIDKLRQDVPPVDKVRLLMTYIVSQEGIKEEDRRRLLEAAHLQPLDETAIINLFYLGITLSRGSGKGTSRRKPPSRGKAPDDAASYDLSRYTPAVKKVTEDVLTGAAPLAGYPYVKDRPVDLLDGAGGTGPGDVGLEMASRKAPAAHPNPSWASRGKSKEERTSLTGPRLVVFVAGGATHSELKCVYELVKVRGHLPQPAQESAHSSVPPALWWNPACRHTSATFSSARRACSPRKSLSAT